MDYRIAVCDDREEDRSFARESVLQWAEKRGFDVDVQEFPSGDAFLFHYTEDRAWDILLLDVEMPGCSGVDLAKQVRKDSQLLQIVFLTGYSDYLAEGYDVSALHYLLKPPFTGKNSGPCWTGLWSIWHGRDIPCCWSFPKSWCASPCMRWST